MDDELATATEDRNNSEKQHLDKLALAKLIVNVRQLVFMQVFVLHPVHLGVTHVRLLLCYFVSIEKPYVEVWEQREQVMDAGTNWAVPRPITRCL